MKTEIKKLGKTHINNILIKYIKGHKKTQIYQCAFCNKHFIKSYNNFVCCCECEINKVLSLTEQQKSEWVDQHSKEYFYIPKMELKSE